LVPSIPMPRAHTQVWPAKCTPSTISAHLLPHHLRQRELGRATMIDWDPFLSPGVGRPPGGMLRPDVPAQPTALDVWLVQVIAGALAAESTCWRCDAQLDPRVRVRPRRHQPRGWRVSVRATCTGWRRHRHHAEAVGEAGDIVLGLLAPKRVRWLAREAVRARPRHAPRM
jgi:hypothetical protein